MDQPDRSAPPTESNQANQANHDLRGALNAALLQLELAQRAQTRQDEARLTRSLAAAREAVERVVALVDRPSDTP